MKIQFLAFVCLLLGSCATTTSTFKDEVQAALASEDSSKLSPLTEADLADLPAPVQRYLRYAGVIGKPRQHVVRLRQGGSFKTSVNAQWAPLEAEQYYFPQQHRFYWLGSVAMSPLVTARARDMYADGIGNVWVQVARIFTVANGKGPKFNISSLIRYFSEMVWFPSAFLDPAITWKSVDDSTAIGILKLHGMQTQATLHFNSQHELILFESNDRYATIGDSLVQAPWKTPMRNYREFHGYRIPTEGEAIYELPQGPFEYARIRILDVDYDTASMYPED